MLEYDVVIVGACTAGTYFANLLVKENLKVFPLRSLTNGGFFAII